MHTAPLILHHRKTPREKAHDRRKRNRRWIATGIALVFMAAGYGIGTMIQKAHERAIRQLYEREIQVLHEEIEYLRSAPALGLEGNHV